MDALHTHGLTYDIRTSKDLNMEGLEMWEALEMGGLLLSVSRPGTCVLVHNEDDYDQKS
jgi:hypothetical protein